MGLQGTEQDQVLVEPYHADEGLGLICILGARCGFWLSRFWFCTD